MILRLFLDRSVFKKIMLAAAVALLPVAGVVLFYVMPLFAQARVADHQKALQQLVETTMSSVENLYGQVRAGAIAEADAKARALAQVGALRYGDGNYFWISDLNANCVLHPIKAELTGKNLKDLKDPNGKAIFVEFANVARTQGAGFVDYAWPRPGSETPEPKLSYVALFKPWGWILGTGVYVDDVAAQVSATRWKIIVFVAGALAVAGAVALWIAGLVTTPLKRIIAVLERVAQGDLTERVELSRRDELGQVAAAANRMIENLRSLVGQAAGARGELAAAAQQISASTAHIAASNQQLSAQTQAVSAASQQMTATVDQVAQNTEAVSAAANGERGRPGDHRGGGRHCRGSVRRPGDGGDRGRLGQAVRGDRHRGGGHRGHRRSD